MATLREYVQQVRELAVGPSASRLLDAAMVNLLEEMAAEVERLSLAVAERKGA